MAQNPNELLPNHRDPSVAALTGSAPQPHQPNLAEDPAHAAKLAEMQALLLAEMRRLDDPWRFWDQPSDDLPPPAPPAPNPAKGKGKAAKKCN